MFKSMDKNKDGSISKDEAKGTPHDKDFAKLDKNSDGKLSPQEHAAGRRRFQPSTPASPSGRTARRITRAAPYTRMRWPCRKRRPR